MATEGDQLKDLIILSRQVIWQYQIEDYTNATLRQIIPALDQARNEIMQELYKKEGIVTNERGEALLDELRSLTLGIQMQLGNDVEAAATIVAEKSLSEYGKILSFDGAIAETVGFNFVQLSASQLKAFVAEPFQGAQMQTWISNIFRAKLTDEIRQELLAGYFKGESYKKLVDRIDVGFNSVRSEVITQARTFIADVNNRASEAVYKANSDIIKWEEWNATLEVSLKSGTSTCIRCASKDGIRFPIGSDHIRPPLHFRCRCFMTPVTKTYKELGLNIPELREKARPFTEREGKPIDTGLTRRILDVGQHKGDFESFLKTRGEGYQKELLGPSRFKLWESGKIKFRDFTDKDGNTRLLKKNKAGDVIGLEK